MSGLESPGSRFLRLNSAKSANAAAHKQRSRKPSTPTLLPQPAGREEAPIDLGGHDTVPLLLAAAPGLVLPSPATGGRGDPGTDRHPATRGHGAPGTHRPWSRHGLKRPAAAVRLFRTKKTGHGYQTGPNQPVRGSLRGLSWTGLWVGPVCNRTMNRVSSRTTISHESNQNDSKPPQIKMTVVE
jgi:hypothetical protein